DAGGFITGYGIDEAGRVFWVSRPDNPVSVTDAWTIRDVDTAYRAASGYAVTSSTYDAVGNLVYAFDAERGFHHYRYNATGTLAEDIWMAGTADESRTAYGYDGAG
ncbi:hypothetical protein GY973_22555, partial [Escherichia coli]|nr:hypothetical protein [Escherichia coli]